MVLHSPTRALWCGLRVCQALGAKTRQLRRSTLALVSTVPWLGSGADERPLHQQRASPPLILPGAAQGGRVVPDSGPGCHFAEFDVAIWGWLATWQAVPRPAARLRRTAAAFEYDKTAARAGGSLFPGPCTWSHWGRGGGLLRDTGALERPRGLYQARPGLRGCYDLKLGRP